MKSIFSIHFVPIIFVLFFTRNSIGANGSEPIRFYGFFTPTPLPQTQYRIEANCNTSSNRLDGHERIQIHNQSKKAISRIIIDWSNEVEIVYEGKPIRPIVKGNNGLPRSQMLFSLPQPISSGETVEMEIDFSFSLRLEAVTKLEGWYPKLWWGRNTSDQYEVKIDIPKEYRIAASGALDTTNNCYVAEHCRKFGFVLMKGLEILHTKSGDTDVYSYYDEQRRKCVEFTHQTAVVAIDFYRKWFGFYPHKILHIVPGGLPHPAGGYPIATSIVGIHGQKFGNVGEYSKEVGYGKLHPGRYVHPWQILTACLTYSSAQNP